MNEEKAMYGTKPEMLRFEVSEKQLVGKQWKGQDGGMVQDILLTDGWIISRPAERLHGGENGRVAFFMSKYKKDGTVNEIALKRSVKTEETGADGKPVYKQEKMTVSVEELTDIMKYGAEKYRYQKEAEAGFITMTIHKNQLGKTVPIKGKEDTEQQYTHIKIGDGYSFLKETEKIRGIQGDENHFRVSLPLKNGEGADYMVNVSRPHWNEKNEFEGYDTTQFPSRDVRKRSDAYRDKIEISGYLQKEQQEEREKEEQEEEKRQEEKEQEKNQEEEREQETPKRSKRKSR